MYFKNAWHLGLGVLGAKRLILLLPPPRDGNNRARKKGTGKMSTIYIGIDYGLGRTNIDLNTGIRYGVIPQNMVLQAWADSSEPDYGDPTCPRCGNEALFTSELEFRTPAPTEYLCRSCDYFFESEEAYPEEPIAYILNDEQYAASSDSDGDIFIVKSLYYTHAQFAPPCAPRAGYLPNHVPEGPKTYCFDHSFFEEGKAPYPVYKVSDGSEVLPK